MTDEKKALEIIDLVQRPRTLVEQKRMDMTMALGEFFDAVTKERASELVTPKLTHATITAVHAAEDEVRKLAERMAGLACRDVLQHQRDVDERLRTDPTVHDPRK